MNDTRYLFFDIDGTLATGDGPLSDAALDAMAQLKAQGHRLFLCTGRTLCDLYPAVLRPGFDGFICGAGAHVLVEGRELYKFTLPLALVRETVAVIQQNRITSVQEGVHGMWHVKGERDIPWTDMPELATPADVRADMEIQKFTLRPHTRQAFDAARPFFERHYHLYPNEAASFVEAVHQNQTKATAMAKVLAHYGAPPEAALAFGDSMNDADILRMAGTGVAMGHAPAALRAAADYVTGTLAEDGVPAALRHLGLIR